MKTGFALSFAALLAALPAQAKEGEPAAAAAADKVSPAATPQEQALLLAGMPLPQGSRLAALEQTEVFKQHAEGISKDWGLLEKRRLVPMHDWSNAELWPRLKKDANVFYFFGGPDFLTSAALFPDAPSYLLCGLETIGTVPDLDKMKPGHLGTALENLRHTLNPIIRSNFFRTNEMAEDLRRSELRGVLPVFYVFLARQGAQILDTTQVEIDEKGALKELAAGEAHGAGVPGVRVRFRGAGKSSDQQLLYFKVNLEDSALEKQPGFLAFFKGFAPGNSLLKAASFILHNKHFMKTRTFILENSLSVLQDDSGIPYLAFKPKHWEFSYYGKYLQPLAPFEKAYQTDLLKAFETGHAKELPFVTGYRKQGQANLLFAIRKPGAADEKAEPAKGDPAKPEPAKPNP